MHTRFDIEKVRKDFPFFSNKNAVGYHYLDSAVTSQKPASVIDSMCNYLRYNNANIHRGVYRLSEQATVAFENTRTKVAQFLGDVKLTEVIFTGGTTSGINLVARTYGEQYLKPGDEILLTVAEHHSNIVPWQQVAEKTGAVIKYIPLTANFRLDMQAAEKLLSSKTKILAFSHVSNVLGTIHPVKKLCALARQVGAISVIDGAQGAPHLEINVKELGCDFYAFSSHKMLGPTGVGVLFGREEILERMNPFLGGGEMISLVSLEKSTWAGLPHKFEAGTPPICEVIGLGAAVDYLQQLPREAMHEHIMKLSRLALTTMRREFPEIRVFAEDGDDWIGTISFHHQKAHAHDVAAIQDSHNVCIRAGHHCAQPLMRYLSVDATSRISPYLYNTEEDIEQFFAGLRKTRELF